jgi:hypothetical protein
MCCLFIYSANPLLKTNSSGHYLQINVGSIMKIPSGRVTQ